ELQRSGKIKGFSTPAALALSPAWMQRNRERLRLVRFLSAAQALDEAIPAEAFSRDSLTTGCALLAELASIATGAAIPDWREKLPKSSSWWFLIDRYFAADPLLTTGFVITNAPIATHQQYEALSTELPVAGVSMILSGWSYTLANLLPWAKHQLLMISALMALFDAVLLAVLYRDWRLWLIQEVTLLWG